MHPEGHPAGKISPPNEYPLRWAVFGLMWVLGILTIIMGIATQKAGWDWIFISAYLTWTLASASCVFIDLKPTKTFVIRNFLYLASIGTVLWFVCTVFKINPDTIPIYIPLCTNLGIFLGIGIRRLWSSSQARIRKSIRIIRASIAEGGNEVELPFHLTPRLDPVYPPPLPQDGEDGPVA